MASDRDCATSINPTAPDYGRETLRRFGFIEGTGRLEPGRFAIGTGGGFSVRLVPPGERPYVWVALDRSFNPTEDTATESSFVGTIHIDEQREFKRLGALARVQHFRPPIGIDLADRAMDTAIVFGDLLSHFELDPTRTETGYHAASLPLVPELLRLEFLNRAELRSRWKATLAWLRREHPETQEWPLSLLRAIRGWIPDADWARRPDIPFGAELLVARSGAVHLSHLRRQPELESPFAWPCSLGYGGIAGRLTLAGQIVCLDAVLRDRFAELVGLARPGADIESMRLLSVRQPKHFDWSSEERRMLERAMSELLQAKQWIMLAESTEWMGAASPSQSEKAPSAELTPDSGSALRFPGASAHRQFALTVDHERMLRHVASRPHHCSTVIEVAGSGQFRNRETVGTLLRDLKAYGLVHQPHGSKKGYSATAAGLDLAAGLSLGRPHPS